MKKIGWLSLEWDPHIPPPIQTVDQPCGSGQAQAGSTSQVPFSTHHRSLQAVGSGNACKVGIMQTIKPQIRRLNLIGIKDPSTKAELARAQQGMR